MSYIEAIIAGIVIAITSLLAVYALCSGLYGFYYVIFNSVHKSGRPTGTIRECMRLCRELDLDYDELCRSYGEVEKVYIYLRTIKRML